MSHQVDGDGNTLISVEPIDCNCFWKNKNIKVKTGDGYHGWAENAPYDAIIVTAAPQQIPKPLIDQLAINGKMVIPVGTEVQDIIILTKTQLGIVEEKTVPVRFVPMRRKAPKG